MKVAMVWVMACCLICVHHEGMSAQQPVYKPQFASVLDCGAPPNSSILAENRQWVSDTSSGFLSLSAAAVSRVVSTSDKDSRLPASDPLSPIFASARIFTARASYTFPVATPGRYWIRLYFLPFFYQQLDLQPVFSVTAASYTLIFNSRSIALSSDLVFKEYSINATSTPLLLTFIPNSAAGSYAFVNAIEVVSMPSDLFTDYTIPLQVKSPTPIGMPYMALETIYRLNVGGPKVTPLNDSQGIFRTWLPNETSLFSPAGVESINTNIASIAYPSATLMSQAPPIVYSTALQINFSLTAYPQGLNLTYALPVEGSYQYMVRLHFCDLIYTSAGKRFFNVYLQNQTAYSNLDLGLVNPKENTPFVRDFSLQLGSGDSSLWIQAGPPPDSKYLDFNKAILNGIEVWKMNNSWSSLDGLGVSQDKELPNSTSRSMLGVIVGATLGGVVALVLMLVGCLLMKRFRGRPAKKKTTAWLPLAMHDEIRSLGSQKSSVGGSTTASMNGGRHFTLVEMLRATKNFDESSVLGVGGFGKVYLGELEDGRKVAVKRGSRGSHQGIAEFRTEVDMLSKLRHRHLVSLIGYCEEQSEMILVYEYMAGGTLCAHLYGSDLPPLPWKRRLEICIGATRGIHYLHTGAAQCIIHRDVKTTNILLDENFVAKMSDFGLSRTGPSLDQTHVSTLVKGSVGYLDPEYFRRQLLTKSSDIFSLGVVFLEVLCARPPINQLLPDGQVNLAEWALRCKSRGTLEDIVDPEMAGSIDGKCLSKFMQLAESCLAEEGVQRPTIGDVLWSLEYALQLQEETSTEEGVSREVASITEEGEGGFKEEQRREEDSRGPVSEDDEAVRSVFSQLVSPQGR